MLAPVARRKIPCTGVSCAYNLRHMERSEAYHRQMLGTTVWKLVVKLGIPTTITMLISNVYNMVDTWFVGTLGTSQQAATGVLFTLQAIIQALAFMMGHGAGTHVAKLLAEKDPDRASTYVTNAFSVSVVVSALFVLFGLIFITPFMTALGSSETVLPYAKDYGFWVIVSAPFLILSLILNNVLRYEGKALFAMIGMVSGTLLNILGDFLFINVAGLGVYGAGMSTAISQIISFIILIAFYFARGQTKLRLRYFRLEGRVYWDIAKAGFPSLLRQGVGAISGGILNNVTKPFGDAAVAAISVVNRYSNFVMCVGLGVGQGLQPVAAYNYAAKRYDRVKEGVIFTVIMVTIVMGLIAGATLFLTEPIVTAFNSDPAVVTMGAEALRYAAISLFVMPCSIIAAVTFQAVRKSLIATLLSALRSGLCFIPTIFVLVYGMDLNYTGVALSQPVADGLTFLISLPFLIVFLVSLGKLQKQAAERENDPE